MIYLQIYLVIGIAGGVWLLAYDPKSMVDLKEAAHRMVGPTSLKYERLIVPCLAAAIVLLIWAWPYVAFKCLTQDDEEE